MSSGGNVNMPTGQGGGNATGATNTPPATSMSPASPAGGKGGYPAQQSMNPYSTAYQPQQQMRQIDNSQFMRGNAYARQPTMRQRYGNMPTDNVYLDEGGFQPQVLPARPREDWQPTMRPPEPPREPELGLRGLMGGMQPPRVQPYYPESPLQPMQRPPDEAVRRILPEVPVAQPMPSMLPVLPEQPLPPVKYE